MGSSSFYKNIFLSILISILFLCINISCSQSTPEIHQANGTVIFDYEDKESLPTARLSVFVEAQSDPRRFEVIKLKSEEKGFEWETNDISKIQNESKSYVGFTNFVMPEQEIIPSGKYSVIFINANEEQVESEFNLVYNLDSYNLTAEEVPDFAKKNKGINKIAIYDQQNKMLYFGNKAPDYMTSRDIWNAFSEADYYYDVWIIKNLSVLFIMPKELVQPEEVE